MKKTLLLAATVLTFSSVMASAQNYDNGKSMRAPAKQHMARADRASAKVLYDYVPASQPARTATPPAIYGISY
ncbi:MAG TPA: hypothetical protein VH206_19300 [Xanthobacteraceae bacterium]|jgi:hypothetical protein|nr:hypothetical protein [Xanthobacteraceae bacterium]